jgi:L-erythro-3,5-diaminohexanoate dehydrogenase
MSDYGFDRVFSPAGVFPQAAEKLDVSLPIRPGETLIRVDRLNLDSASFHQLWNQSKKDPEILKKEILRIVRERGKMHNPVTNSGGTLLGTVEEGMKKGERIATLVSLSLTPLHLDEIVSVDLKREQVAVKGYAILFKSGIAAPLPSDFSESAALAIFDVCGAPALVAQMAKEGETVVILGAGKAGLLSAAQAKKQVGKKGKVILLEKEKASVAAGKSFSFVDLVLETDLQTSTQTFNADLVVNCVNVPGTEMASILAAKKNGTVLFFNMATNFQAAVLGGEGIGHETRLVMGNGYTPRHAELALNLVREIPELKNWFEKR